MSFEYPTNLEISSEKVRLNTDDGQSSIVPTREALAMAHDQNLDLIAINTKSSIPVCKIADFGKFKYELTKREKEHAKKTRESKIIQKEIQIRVVTDKNDLRVKANKAKEFVAKGYKVRIVVKFRSREVQTPELGFNILKEFLDFVGNHKVEKEPTMTGRDMVVLISK